MEDYAMPFATYIPYTLDVWTFLITTLESLRPVALNRHAHAHRNAIQLPIAVSLNKA
jgi:hypothetical protein